MDEVDPLERIHQIETQCNKIKYFLSALQIYFILQLVIVIFNLITPSLYDYQKASIIYLIQRLIQYLFHLYSVLKVKRTLDVISEGSLELIHQIIEQVDVWAAIKGNHQTLQKANEFIYLIMFIVGNVVLFQNALKISLYVLVIQLLLGWIAITIAVLLVLVICLVLPFMIYHISRTRRQEQLRRQQQAENLISNQKTFESLNIDVNQPCYICLDQFQPTDLVVQLTCNQNHIFHSECLKPWAETSDTCPVCRQRLLQQ